MPGRKRGLAVDVLGLVIAVAVLAANVHDNTAGIALLSEVAVNAGGTVRKALVDQGFKTQVVTHGAGLGIDVEIVQRDPQHKGFVPQPKRWRVEQTYGILILHRRLVRDYEYRTSSSSSRVYWAMTHVGPTPVLSEQARAVKDMRTALASRCQGLAFVVPATADTGPGSRFSGCPVTSAKHFPAALSWAGRCDDRHRG